MRDLRPVFIRSIWKTRETYGTSGIVISVRSIASFTINNGEYMFIYLPDKYYSFVINTEVKWIICWFPESIARKVNLD